MKEIKLDKHCQDCSFFFETEDGDIGCVLHRKDLEKDDDYEPVRPEFCKETMIVTIK
jgi:hypothetical protein